ncbi:MAG TPA: hypothetical protein VMT24_00030 [Aggregatilineaceae bacterium]|nr:hypothetical protein [Aggregatilineaceae bacterium]
MKTQLDDMLERGPIAINVGLRDLADSLEAQEVEVTQVDWSPPAGGDSELIDLRDKLL